MSPIRPYTKADVPQVIDLHQRCLLEESPADDRVLRFVNDFYQDALFEHPWRDPDLPPLVYEQNDGAVTGFLGVLPRPMTFHGKPIRAAIATRFMVDHKSPRSGLVAGALFRHFLQGPQDLSLTDVANEQARRIWQATGATLIPLLSLRWTYTIDPSARPTSSSGLSSRRLHIAELLDSMEAAERDRALRPVFDEASLEWLLDYLANAAHRGVFQGRAVVDAEDRLVGWYLYYSNPQGYDGILQLGAVDGTPAPVLTEALARARAEGASSVEGRFDLSLLEALRAHGCGLKMGYWSLAHADDPAILLALSSGDAYLSGLMGEF